MADFNFMNSPNFGAQGGVAANQSEAMNRFALQQAPLHTDLLRAQIQQSSAHALNETADAQMKQMQLRDMQNEGKVLAQMGKEQATSPQAQAGHALDQGSQLQALASHYFDAADRMFKGDAPVAGQKFLKQAVDLETKAASINKSVAQTTLARLNGELKSTEIISQSLGNATNAQDYNNKRLALLQNPDISAEDKQYMMQLPYSPEAIQAINEHALKYKDKIALQIRQATADAQIRKDQAQTRAADFNANLKTFQQKEEIRATVKAKIGAVKQVPASLVRNARNALTAEHFPGQSYSLLDPDSKAQVDSMAQKVAERTLQIQQETKLPESAAQMRAVMENRKNWTQTTGGLMSGFAKTTTLKGTQTAPLPWEPAATDRKEGSWYMIPAKGYALRWDPAGDPPQPWSKQ